METRVIMRIELMPTARERFMKVPDKFGMTQVTVTSRLMEWFAAQSSEAQASVLGLMPAYSGVDAAKEFVKRMARG